MKVIRRKSDLRRLTDGWRRAGETIGVVPTMGALHDGHLSLVKAAREGSDRVIVTLFVNPRQFNSAEDLENYPRTEDSDAQKLAPFRVDVLYIPDPDQVYPDGFATSISITGVTECLCGATRPGHFDGVATVVTKLLTQTDADRAFFGEKDYQQLLVVRRLVTDLDLRCEIVGCPTVREQDGLAMSSRNLRLTDQGRETAPVIRQTLQDTAQDIANGTEIADALNAARTRLSAAGMGEIDYLEARSDPDLELVTTHQGPARIFIAIWLDGIRLIDNIPIPKAD